VFLRVLKGSTYCSSEDTDRQVLPRWFGKKQINLKTDLRSMAKTAAVSIPRDLLDSIYESARQLYPKETVLLLRGKKKKDTIYITDLLVAPFATYGYGFANLPFHMLPMDFSIMGMVHSHPSGDKSASDVDATISTVES
jgi:hypothetical protein